MKIIDSFLFYNELDLLFYRLSILYELVDFFILVESTHTFTGNTKPLYYEENKERFSKFHHKIVHIVVNDIPFKAPNIRFEWKQQWENEYFQRNCIERGIKSLMPALDDGDILLTSDVDEIPNPNILVRARNNSLVYNHETLNRLALDMYYYNLHYRVKEESNWHGIKLMTIFAFKTNKLTFQQMRLWEHSHFVPVVEKGGWHLTYFGDVEFIMKKIDSFSHQEYNNSNYIDKKELELKMKNGINLLNLNEENNLIYIPIEENKNLPYQYDEYLKNFYIS
jgi:beta-1,4-mannosyl-glycoprotein beta-1,4-N-acetylglucosaminyltransferase